MVGYSAHCGVVKTAIILWVGRDEENKDNIKQGPFRQKQNIQLDISIPFIGLSRLLLSFSGPMVLSVEHISTRSWRSSPVCEQLT